MVGTGSPDDVARSLLASLNEQVSRYEQVRDLSVEQNDSIQQGRTESLLQILGRKQELIVSIDAVGHQVDQLRNQYEPVRESVAPELRAQLEQTLEILKHVLGQIVALEDEGKALLANEQDDKGGSLLHIQKGKAMHKAYGSAPVRPEARFKDRNA